MNSLGIIGTIISGAWICAWYISGKSSRIDEKFKYLEKTVDEVKAELKELRKLNI